MKLDNLMFFVNKSEAEMKNSKGKDVSYQFLSGLVPFIETVKISLSLMNEKLYAGTDTSEKLSTAGNQDNSTIDKAKISIKVKDIISGAQFATAARSNKSKGVIMTGGNKSESLVNSFTEKEKNIENQLNNPDSGVLKNRQSNTEKNNELFKVYNQDSPIEVITAIESTGSPEDIQQKNSAKNSKMSSDNLIKLVSNAAKTKQDFDSISAEIREILKNVPDRSNFEKGAEFGHTMSEESGFDGLIRNLNGLNNVLADGIKNESKQSSKTGTDNIFDDAEKIIQSRNAAGQDKSSAAQGGEKIKIMFQSRDVKFSGLHLRSETSSGVDHGNFTGSPETQFFTKDSFIVDQVVELDNIKSVLFDSVKLYKSNGTNEMELSLEPDYLGKLEIRIKSKNEKIDIFIKASVRYTSDLLQDNIQMLKDRFTEKGMDINQINISIEEPLVKNEHGFADMQSGKEQGNGSGGLSGSDVNGGISESVLDISSIASENSYYLNELI